MLHCVVQQSFEHQQVCTHLRTDRLAMVANTLVQMRADMLVQMRAHMLVRSNHLSTNRFARIGAPTGWQRLPTGWCKCVEKHVGAQQSFPHQRVCKHLRTNELAMVANVLVQMRAKHVGLQKAC